MFRIGPAQSKADKGHWECCKDERHVFLKMNIASLLELSQNFWLIWNGQHSRKEGNSHDSQWCLKWSLVISYTDFHPVYDLKDVRALGNSILRNSFKLMPKQTNIATQFYCMHVQSDTGNLYKVVSLKSSQWRLSKRPSWAIFKNANPELFIITIFIHSTFAPWLYLNTSTCTITHPPWWEIPFADNTIRIRIRITEGLPAKFHAFNRKWTIEAHICSALSKLYLRG